MGPGSRGARIAKWSVAKQLRCLGRLDEALSMQRELEPEGDGFVHEEIAECLHASGDEEAARPYFARAHAELKQIDWVEKERLERLERLAAG